MERRKFIKTCCISIIGIPIAGLLLQSCNGIYYAIFKHSFDKLILAKSEFIDTKNKYREFVLIKPEKFDFPICIYKTSNDTYVASLLKCTHRNCELNVGGGIYTCPCHGSEFSTTGKVLEGPAEQDLTTYKIETDYENIYIYLS